MNTRNGGLILILGLSPASALASESDEGASIALLAGYGQSSGENVLGWGAGFRAGYRLDFGLYLGALALAHLGSSDEGEPDVKHHAQSVRGEVGYEFRIEKLYLRPTLRAGAALVTTARDVDGEFVSPDAGLGLTVLQRLDDWLVGIDAEGRVFTRLVDNGDNAYQIATLGGYLSFGRQF
jgi:hypothetical protein